MLKVWIAGANGQIGRALNDVLDPMQIETLNTDLDELDITDTDEVINFGSINRPDVIINCTGITDTDECEKNPEHAYRVNALGARNLSIVARKCGAKIVQLSTDDYTDGAEPLTEMDTDFMLKTLDHIKVFEDGTLLVVFLDGTEIECKNEEE